MPGHTTQNTLYKVYGTNEPYTGKVVEISGDMYSTVGGALEGTSLQLVSTQINSDSDSVVEDTVDIISEEQNTNGNMNNMNQQNNSNPVVRTFRNRFQEPTPGDRIYEYIRTDGSPGSMNLHEHQDGTIMEGHNPNDMGVVVMLNPIFGTINPNPNIPPVLSTEPVGGNGGTGGNGRGGNGNTNRGGGGMGGY